MKQKINKAHRPLSIYQEWKDFVENSKYFRGPKSNHVCVPCRFSAKSAVATMTCPHCHSSMFDIGCKWRIPKKNKDKDWLKMKQIIERKKAEKQQKDNQFKVATKN